jgi:hypothetical protein
MNTAHPFLWNKKKIRITQERYYFFFIFEYAHILRYRASIFFSCQVKMDTTAAMNLTNLIFQHVACASKVFDEFGERTKESFLLNMTPPLQ